MTNLKEPYARALIDQHLKDVGWNILDTNQVSFEDMIGDGFTDYILKDSKGRPLAVLEAKRPSKDPRTADKQAKEYADNGDIPFIFLSNGNEHYFWDRRNQAKPRKINTFYTQADLEKKNDLLFNQVNLSSVEISDIIGGNNRTYQIDCMNELTKSYEQGKNGMLIEMATGLGKTRIAGAFIDRMLKSYNAHRVLFMVDRDSLAKQTVEEFQDLLPQYTTQHIKKTFDISNQISVATLQTLQNKYFEMPSSYFDLIIIDECHRSIYGKWRGVIDHFDAVRVGLTATPCISNDDEDSEISKFIRDTFRFFNVDKPTFSYGMKDGIENGYLTGYKIFKAQTVKTAGEDGEIELSKNDIDLNQVNDDKIKKEIEFIFGENDTAMFPTSALERTITIPSRNAEIVNEFKSIQENGYHNPKGELIKPKEHLKGGIEKTIVFAVTQRHATDLAELFDRAFSEQKENNNERIADFVTSDRDGTDDIIRKFKDYNSNLRILVSVGMLDTGFDCPEVCNLVFARFTESEILYRQMRGRGCRLSPTTDKEQFYIYDFTGVVDFHGDNEESPTGGVIITKPPKPIENKRSRLLLTFHNADDWIDPMSRQIWETSPDGELRNTDDIVNEMYANNKHTEMTTNLVNDNEYSYTMEQSTIIRTIINQIVRNGLFDSFKPAHLNNFGLNRNNVADMFDGEENFLKRMKNILGDKNAD